MPLRNHFDRPTALRLLGALLIASTASACSEDDDTGLGVRDTGPSARDAGIVAMDAGLDEMDAGQGGGDAGPADSGIVASRTSQGRLFVRVTVAVDGGTMNRTEVIDLDDGTQVAELPFGARIHPDSRARFGILNESFTVGRLRYVDPGVALDGDVIVKTAPSVLTYETESESVLNVEIGPTHVGFFSDIGSVGRFIDTTPLPSAAPNVVTIDRNQGLDLVDPNGMGGQATQWGDSFFVSVVSEGNPPFPAGPIPTGVQRFNTTGEAFEEYDCLGLGFASEGNYAAFACSDGILELRGSGMTITPRRIPYALDTTSCFQMIGAPGVSALLAVCSDSNTFQFLDLLHLTVPDGVLTSIPGTAGRWTTHLAGTEEFVYLERSTGDLVVRALETGEERRRAIGVVAPFPMFPVSWSTVSGNFMYVGFVASNAPAGAEDAVLEVDLREDPPSVSRTFPVSGTPGRVEVLGAVQ